MQRLSYINLLGARLELCAEPYLLASVKGLGAGELDVVALKGAYQQGDTAVGFRRGVRRVEAKFAILADSREEMYRLRADMQRILSPDAALCGSERARLIYENDNGRRWTWAVPESLDNGKRVCNVENGLTLTFRCESPYWYALAQSEAEFSYSGDGFTLPFAFPLRFGTMDFSREINNLGHVRAFPEVRIFGSGETPTLHNRTTGAVIALRSALPEGSVLYLNTDPARLEASVTDAQGARTNAFGQLDISHPLTDFWLRPGLNRLEYDAGGADTQSVIKVNWYAAYEGV